MTCVTRDMRSLASSLPTSCTYEKGADRTSCTANMSWSTGHLIAAPWIPSWNKYVQLCLLEWVTRVLP